MSLAIDHVSVRYGTIDALLDVSIHATPGRIVTLLGPNASGKSTLLRSVAGLMRPERGTITWNGRSIASMSARMRAQAITYLSQQSSPVRDFTVREVIEFGRYALGRDDRVVNDAMHRTEVAELADRPMQELSGGQQQRVTLARALAQVADGGCLVLDEPTSALDLSHVRMTIEILEQLRSRGVCVIAAVHDLALASTMADDVWLLDQGRLVAHGSVDDVLTPAILEPVFHVKFAWVTPDGGRAVLLPRFQDGNFQRLKGRG